MKRQVKTRFGADPLALTRSRRKKKPKPSGGWRHKGLFREDPFKCGN
jgi:hypothetical protein